MSDEPRERPVHTADTVMVDQPDILLAQLRKELAEHYEVQDELGRGGMAVVYRAVERDLHRTVALKVLPPGMGGANMAERFKREARLAASLDHQHIIPVYRVGQAAGTHYFAMKFVEGRAVDAMVESQGALTVPVVLLILRGAASALAFAHQRGIVHRDIKGANILVDRDGRVLVSDFGIARAAEEKTLTASGSVIGTPHFMSPEQCSGKKVGPQSDQYSLGILAFQMLTGSVPFDADSLMAILQHHFFTAVPDIAAVRDDVPPALIAVVFRSLAKDPELRFASTDDMVRALEEVPLPDAERRDAEATLKQLAAGAAVPKVRTGSLPPLQQTRMTADAVTPAATSAPTVVAPPSRFPAKPGSAAKRPNRSKSIAAAAVVLVLAGGGAVVLQQNAQRRATAAADSVRADSTRRAAADARDRFVTDSTRRADSARIALQAAAPADTPAARRSARPSRPTPAQPAPVTAPAGTGLLRVSTDPTNAQIYVDNRLLGQGNVFDEELSAGTHRLRITAPGHQTHEQTFTIEAGATRTLGRIRLPVTP